MFENRKWLFAIRFILHSIRLKDYCGQSLMTKVTLKALLNLCKCEFLQNDIATGCEPSSFLDNVVHTV